MKLDDLIVLLVVVGFIILKIAKAVKAVQPPPVRTPQPSPPREVEVTPEDIEEMLGRRRQLATPASQGQTPGTAPGSQGRSGFPMATEEEHEFEDMSEVLVRGGPPGGPVIPGLPATPVPSGQRTPPPFPEAIEIDVEPWERRRRPRAPSSRRQTEEEVRPRATEAAPGRLPHQPEHPPSGRPRKPHAETPSFHLPVGLTPMQRAIIFAEILGKPGGRDPYF